MANIAGTGSNDTLNGTASGDNILGLAGNDSALGNAGNDTIATGAGNDTISGGAGNDTIYGDSDQAGTWAYSVYDRNFTNSNGQAFNIQSGTLRGSGIASGFDVGGHANTARGTTGNPEDFGIIYTTSFTATTAGTYFFRTASDDGSTVQLRDAAGNLLTWSNQSTGQNGLNYMNNDFLQGTTSRQGSVTLAAGQTYTIEVRFWENQGANTLTADVLPPGGTWESLSNNTTFIGVGEYAGNDTIDGDAGDDLIYAGAGNDNLDGGAGNDTVYGGAGNDIWQAGDTGDDLHYGGAGDDVVSGDAGNDTIYGDDGNDAIEGHNGADTVYGGAGNDYIAGFDVTAITTPANRTLTPPVGSDDGSNDYLEGGSGNDTLLGGQGRDTLIGGAGNDYMIGGTGPDLFVAQGADTITDFDATTGVTPTATGVNTDNDFVDLSAFYNATTLAAWNAANPGNQYDNALKWLRGDQADGILQSADGLRILNGGSAVAGNLLNVENTAVCFAEGTRIATAKGQRPIEKLQVGDLVQTADHGLQPIRWIGSMAVDGRGDLAPILISAGTLGNRRDIMVSPLHRLLLSGWQVELMFGEDEVLAAAKMLVNGGTIRPVPMEVVSYFHIMFDAHEVVFAEGAGAESFHPGEEGFDALGQAACDEIIALFPQLAANGFAAYGPSARRSLRAHEARLLNMGRKLARTDQMQSAPRKKAMAAK
ncbi:MAG: Hint domain-containing protein [Cypionkella sp.]|nr:Hint domain-containing protein [Cypionkella sp.]